MSPAGPGRAASQHPQTPCPAPPHRRWGRGLRVGRWGDTCFLSRLRVYSPLSALAPGPAARVSFWLAALFLFPVAQGMVWHCLQGGPNVCLHRNQTGPKGSQEAAGEEEGGAGPGAEAGLPRASVIRAVRLARSTLPRERPEWGTKARRSDLLQTALGPGAGPELCQGQGCVPSACPTEGSRPAAPF